MKRSISTTISTVFTVVCLLFLSCKVKKQAVTEDKIDRRSTLQSSAEKQKTENLIQHTIDSSKFTQKDSALISVTERDDFEYDYPNPATGSPSKIVQHIEKTTNFQAGTNIIDQKNVKSVATANLEDSEKQNEIKVIHVNKNHHSVFSVISSSVSWIWIIGLAIVVAVVVIYLIKRLNLITMIKSIVTKSI